MSKIGSYPMAGNSLNFITRHAVHRAGVDSTAKKRELNWYVKVEERRP